MRKCLRPFFWVFLTLPLFIITACNTDRPEITVVPSAIIASSTPEPSAVASPTAVPPTPTPIPLAAVVNGEAITLEEYEAEVERYQASMTITGTVLATDANTMVMNELINQTLFAQGAAENGFIVDEDTLNSRIETLETQLGGTQALEAWIAEHGYTRDGLDQALKRSIGAAWMRDQIINALPETAEEVHGMQILLPTSAEADEVYKTLQAGEEFEQLALDYDPLTGGDLGWFPRGFLDSPEIDEAIFALEIGQYSTVIETEIGFHILYVADKDASHLLEPGARIALQVIALNDWLAEKREQSEIQVLVP